MRPFAARPNETDAQGSPAGWELAALAGVLALAFALRLVGLNSSLWYDEIFTLVNFVRLPTAELLTSFSSLNNHMFYSLQAQASVAAFGESAWALRLPAVLFGVASLVPIWLMSRQAAGRLAALLVVFLLAVSYHHVWFSQNARGYTGLLFWTSMATLALIEGLRRPGWRPWTLYAFSVAAAMYTHLSAGFFFAAHGVVYLGAQAAARLRRAPSVLPGLASPWPLIGVGLAVALTAALHAPLFTQVAATVGEVSQSSGAETGALAQWRSPLRAMAEITASVSGLGPLGPAAMLGALAVLVLGAASLCRRQPILSAVYILSIPVAIILLSALSFRIWPRYFFVDIGFVYLCVVHGVLVAARWVAARLVPARPARAVAALVAAGAVAMTAGSLILLARNYAHPKQDFIGAKALVERERDPRDAVAAVGLAGFAYGRLYAPGWSTPATLADLAALRAHAPAVWVVVAFPDQARSALPAVMASLESDYRKVAVLPGTLGDGEVEVYRSR